MHGFRSQPYDTYAVICGDFIQVVMGAFARLGDCDFIIGGVRFHEGLQMRAGEYVFF